MACLLQLLSGPGPAALALVLFIGSLLVECRPRTR
jgi:hypothetical protein